MNHNFLKEISKSGCCISPFFWLAMIMMGVTSFTFGQTRQEKVQQPRSQSDEPIFMVVEQQPEFPGGPEAKRAFFSKNLIKPNGSLQTKGWVLISFVVDADGSFQDVKLFRSLASEYDKEALRVVNLMPKWIPGRQSGKIVRVRYIQPVDFR